MKIEIKHEHDKLNRQVYNFALVDIHGDPFVKLQSYVRESKPSTRHRKWVASEKWSMYKNRMDFHTRVKTSELEIPEWVIGKALDIARGRIEFRPPND